MITGFLVLFDHLFVFIVLVIFYFVIIIFSLHELLSMNLLFLSTLGLTLTEKLREIQQNRGILQRKYLQYL
jgi:hypothetical protein